MKELLQVGGASLVGLVAAFLIYTKHRQGYWERAGVPFIEPSWLYGNVKELFLMKKTECEVLDYFYKRLKVSQLNIIIMSIISLLKSAEHVSPPSF
jgi:hypothetical protein